MAEYKTTIGIETHVQLKTKTKLFCRCLNDPTTQTPNINICPICLGMPGALPYLNQKAIALTLQAGLALNAQIAKTTKFDRKHYFYPDLPKGYQISQYDQPLILSGRVGVPLNDRSLEVGITRVHLEEDAGKSTHPEGKDYSLVDLNRAGTPLLEIVSEPDISTPAEAKAYVQELYLSMLYAGVSDVDLYRGNMRFDVNISVAKPGAKALGLRTEVKNLNSFKAVERASAYEVKRQTELLAKGQPPTQDTRGWDEAKGKTYPLRSKEGEADYRYFPEPDLPPLKITPAMIKQAQNGLPALPASIRPQLVASGLDIVQAESLLFEPRLVGIFLSAAKGTPVGLAKRIANWLRRDIKTITSTANYDWGKFKLVPTRLVELAQLVEEGKLGSSAAEQVLVELVRADASPLDLARNKNLLQVSDAAEIEKIVEAVLKANPTPAADFKAGNERSLQFLVGQVMKASQGQANPQLAGQIIKKQLAR